MNENPPAIDVVARIVVASTGRVIDSESLSIPVRPYVFDVGLTFQHKQVSPEGAVTWQAVATASRSVKDTGYAIRILNGSGLQIARCTRSSICAAWVGIYDYYKAEVIRAGMHVGGHTFWTYLDMDAATEQRVGGVDTRMMALAIGGVAGMCSALLEMQGTNFIYKSTVNDPYLICEQGRAAGWSFHRVAGSLTPTGSSISAGAILTAILVFDAANGPTGTGTPGTGTGTGTGTGSGEEEEENEDPPPPPPPEPTYPLDLATQIKRRNTGYATFDRLFADMSKIKVLADACSHQMVLANMEPVECVNYPLFVTGGMDAMGPAAINKGAQRQNRDWIFLNYASRGDNGQWYYKRSGWWYDEGKCVQGQVDPVTGRPTQCHEFPYFSTQQGFPKPDPAPGTRIPAFKVTDWSQNHVEGTKLGGLYRRCNMQSTWTSWTTSVDPPAANGSLFISLPIRSYAIPTIGLCNDNRGADDS